MKTLPSLLALILFAAIPVSAQEQIVTESKPAATEAAAHEKQRLETKRRASRSIEKRTLFYSGFFVELSRAEDKKQLLSLRQPVNPKLDSRNLFLDQRTNRPKGFILFALDF